MPNLNDFDKVVARMMKDFGGTGTFSIVNPGVRDLDTGDMVITSTEYSVQAILLDLTLRSNGLSVVDNTLIQAGDKQCFVRPLNKSNPLADMPIPQPNKDKFSMGGVTYKIVTVKKTDPSATNNVMLELYLRQ